MTFFAAALLTVALTTGDAFLTTFLAGDGSRFAAVAVRRTGASTGDWGANERGEAGLTDWPISLGFYGQVRIRRIRHDALSKPASFRQVVRNDPVRHTFQQVEKTRRTLADEKAGYGKTSEALSHKTPECTHPSRHKSR
jgi:hypothetical protein